jgi:hypothetical protein
MQQRSRSAADRRNGDARARICADLERLGVAVEMQEAIARRLEALARTLAPAAYEAALAGAALAHGVHRENEQALRESVRDLGEIQRLLGAFSEETRKLDEALQILTTYVKRMRSRTRPPERPRIVH